MAAAVTAAVVVAITAWTNAVRRYLLRLMSRREEARAFRRAFDGLVEQVRADDKEKARFADDADGVERHSLSELRDRSRLLAQELNTVALPKRLWPSAEALADACDILAEEAGRVGDEALGDEVLEGLDAIDLSRVDAAFKHADREFARMTESLGVEDSKESFGGGLYY